MYEFIYLLQTRESLKNNENIFKIGRTCRPELGRFNDYPKGSIQKPLRATPLVDNVFSFKCFFPRHPFWKRNDLFLDS